ncbi:MAG: ATP-binding protein [Pyrobaculum sp.]
MRNLFDPRPKKSRKELYDREKELEFLDKNVEKPLIAVLGIRRIGKTSLLKAFLEPHRGVYVDMRGVTTQAELYERLADALTEGWGKVKEALRGVRGIEVMGVGVSIKWRGRGSISLVGLLEELNKKGRFIIVFDEVQEARPPISAELKRAAAYAYDNLENLTVILSGSQIGLLERFMATEDASSPLYGRYVARLTLPRFTREQSLDFLQLGFKEAGVAPPPSQLEEAVDFFDGIPGWLVHFGLAYLEGGSLEAAKEAAVALALEELAKLSKREKLVLRAVAQGASSWAAVRRYVEEASGEALPKSTTSRLLDKLEALGIIKDFKFLDPVYREAAKRL